MKKLMTRTVDTEKSIETMNSYTSGKTSSMIRDDWANSIYRGFNYLSSFLTLVMTFILVNGPLQHTRRTRSSIFTISRICIVIQLLAMAYSTYKRLIKVVQLVNKITITFCHLQGIFILEALLGKRPIVNDTA